MLRITKDGVPSLRAPSKEVPLPLEDRDRKLLTDMLEHLKESQDASFREKHPAVREGIGLAAPQAGVNRRLLVIHYPKDEEGNYQTYCLANPEIVSQSVKECYLESGEGCLSVDKEHPGYSYRSYRIKVEAYDALLGQKVLIKAIGFDAIVLQHEIDHLDGILFYDRIDKKDPFLKKPGAVAL